MSVGLTLLNDTACPVVQYPWALQLHDLGRGGSDGGTKGRVALGGRLLDEQRLGAESSKPCIRETISSLLALFRTIQSGNKEANCYSMMLNKLPTYKGGLIDSIQCYICPLQ